MDWVDHYRRHFRQQLAARGVTAWPDEAPASEPAPVPPPVPADTPLGPSAVAAPRPTPQHDPAPVELNQDALLALGRGIDRRLSGRVPPALVRHMVKAIPELMPRVLQEAVADRLRERKAPKPDRPLSKSEAFIQHNAAIRATELVPEIRLYLADEITPIWEATEESLKEQGLPPPFWAFAWPGGQALARWALDHPEQIAGRQVAALGAGAGLEAIAAARSGAALSIANDVDPTALAAAQANAALNGVEIQLDGRDYTAEGAPPPTADLLLLGDAYYEQRLSAAFDRLAEQAAAAGVEILIASPDRPHPSRLELDVLATYDAPVPEALEDATARKTRVSRVRAAAVSSGN